MNRNEMHKRHRAMRGQKSRREMQEDSIAVSKERAQKRFLLQVARWCAVTAGITPKDVRTITGWAEDLRNEMEEYLGINHFTAEEIGEAIWSYAKRSTY